MKYIAYYRVSTKKQDYGLAAQRNACEDFVKKKNGVILNSYEEKESGKNNNRPALAQAIQESKEKNATLLIAKLDRLARNVSFIFSLKESQVDFVACDLPDANTLTIGIFATMAQHEREIISQRTKAGLAVAKSKGRIGGRRKGFKYSLSDEIKKKIKENSIAVSLQHLEKHKNTLLVLSKHIHSYNQIAKEMTTLKIPTIRGSKVWHHTQVKSALKLLNI